MAFSKNFVNELYKDTLDVSEAAAEEFISSVSNGQIEKIMFVIKRDGTKEKYNVKKIKKAVISAYQASNEEIPQNIWRRFNYYLKKFAVKTVSQNELKVEDIQDIVEYFLMKENHTVAKNYILYRERRKKIRDFVERKINWIENYKKSANTADATIDDNSNVSGKNIGIINAEIHKPDNIEISRGMIMGKLKELYPDFDAKNYVRDLMHHIIYKNDESSFAGSIAPYCVSVSMYEFMLHGLKNIGGQSAAPHNLDSYCGLFINFIFAVSGQFAGAVAVPEALLYFDYFARHSLGEKYYEKPDEFTLFGNELKELMKTSGKMIFNIDDINEIASSENGKYNNKAKNLAIKLAGSYKDGRLEDDSRTISSYISQKFQQIIYSINQPVAARGLQSAFVNFSYFDKPFYDNMFGKNTSFSFPDLSKPVWESFSWLQRYFCQWFNEERLKTVLTFPVESWALIYKNGKYADEDTARFVAAEFARGHSMFLYQSDTVDSLSSCCRLKNKITTHEFNFTNGNMGVETGSKSVITLNLSRITQDYCKTDEAPSFKEDRESWYKGFCHYLNKILSRVYKYHTAYNERLWDMYDANLLTIYKAGFISLNKQYMTIGLNGLNQAAEFLGIRCNDNPVYSEFCRTVFSDIKNQNTKHNGTEFGHKLTFNTEQIPAESLAVKNYNWDKKDGYWVPDNINLYASYIFEPYDESTSVLEKLRMHGNDYIGDYLDGGAAAHINLKEHPTEEQYWKLMNYSAQVGCQYWTVNVPNRECKCGYIAKHQFTKCPKCGATDGFTDYSRIIGYLTPIKNWSKGRQIEEKKRIYASLSEEDAKEK